MSATNYARSGGGKRGPLVVRFFAASDEVPADMRCQPWVWWRVPRDYHEVRLVGETSSEWHARVGKRGRGVA